MLLYGTTAQRYGAGMPAAAPDDRRRSGIQVIARTAELLRALERMPTGLNLSELALAVGLPKSTVHRLVTALQEEALITAASGGKLRLGREITRLGAASRSAALDHVRPYLLRLSQETEETVDLSVLDGHEIRFVDHVAGPHRLVAASAVGVAFPLHCCANGKALLAAMQAEHAEALLPSRLQALTPKTIVSRKELWATLEQVRAERVAFDREEQSEGICAVGALVYDPYGPAAAISVPTPAGRFYGNEDALATRLLAVCDECSAALGAELPLPERNPVVVWEPAAISAARASRPSR
jgi:DNA-binding IclR family transcriptional regulator